MGFADKLSNSIGSALTATDPLNGLRPILSKVSNSLGGPKDVALPPPVMPMAQGAVIRTSQPAPSINVPAEQATTRIVGPRPSDDNTNRRRAAGAAGASGVTLPPVGVRGAGAAPRTAILGR